MCCEYVTDSYYYSEGMNLPKCSFEEIGLKVLMIDNNRNMKLDSNIIINICLLRTLYIWNGRSGFDK